VLLAELSHTDAAQGFDLPLAEAILAAVLPLLAQRARHALGAMPTPRHNWLTPREELVLGHLLAGKSVPEIAGELQRSVYTVHDHVKNLHKKLGANSRGELVARALGHLNPVGDADEGRPPDCHIG
jgi:DNA-binding NarL/FixJ family response regulator